MNEIIITISGPVNSGKSRITYLLKKILNDNNFLVNFEVDNDYTNEFHFDRIIRRNFDESLINIKQKSFITIRQTQLSRHEMFNEKRYLKIIRKIKLKRIANANRTN